MKPDVIAAFRLQDRIAQDVLGSTDLSLRSWCKNRGLNYRSISDAVRGERPMQLVHIANMLEAGELFVMLRPLGPAIIVDGRRHAEEHAVTVGSASSDAFERARYRIADAASDLIRGRRRDGRPRRVKVLQDTDPRHATRPASGVTDDVTSALRVFMPADREDQILELGTDTAPSGRLIIQIAERETGGTAQVVDVLAVAPLTAGGDDFQFVTDTESL
jgi:hypothetical protein